MSPQRSSGSRRAGRHVAPPESKKSSRLAGAREDAARGLTPSPPVSDADTRSTSLDLHSHGISGRVSIESAMKQMNRTAQQTLLVIGPGNHLLGVLTDGDIRRFILRTGGIQGTVLMCCNRSPLYVTEATRASARALMREKIIQKLPVVDSRQRVVDIILGEGLLGTDRPNPALAGFPVVIMAGGMGVRLEPFTKILPKPLMPIGDKPVIEHIMDRMNSRGFQNFYLSVHHKAEMIKSYFDNTKVPYRIRYLREKTFLGTAGSLRLLPAGFPDTFVLSNCDILVEADYKAILDYHLNNGNLVTVVGAFQQFQIPYGVIAFSKEGRVKEIREKPSFDYTVNAGVYVIQKSALTCIPKGDGLFHMTDLIRQLLRQRKKVGLYHVDSHSFVDIGELELFKKNVGRIIEITNPG